MQKNGSRILIIILALTFIDYLIGMIMIDLMEVDTMQYASITREMLDSGNFLQVYHRHLDYLDKPPLIFWLSSLSFHFLGRTAFAFRVPSFLFTILGAFSTFKLGKLYYNKQTGLLAAVVLTTSQAWFMISNDPKTDTILAGAVIFGVWQLIEYINNKKALNFFLGFIGVSLAMLEKGPIGLMVPVLAIGTEIIYYKKWKSLFKWQWIAGLLVILILLSPMLWGLYKQFGWEGIRFYFWTQSFGRITGENVWENSAGPFYFVHTFLWTFLPWMVLAIYGTGLKIRDIIKNIRGKDKNIEVLSLAGFLLPFITFSFSHFKLPQYIFVCFPFISILTAYALQTVMEESHSGRKKGFFFFQSFLNIVLWFAALYIGLRFFPITNPLIWSVTIVLFFLSVYYSFNKKQVKTNIILPSAFSIIAFNFLLNTNFYPKLMQYQSGTIISEYVKEKKIPVQHLYMYDDISHSLDFHLGTIVPALTNTKEIIEKLNSENEIFLIVPEEKKNTLLSYPVQIKSEKEFDSFRISRLSSSFLNPQIRPQVVKKVYLLELQSKQNQNNP